MYVCLGIRRENFLRSIIPREIENYEFFARTKTQGTVSHFIMKQRKVSLSSTGAIFEVSSLYMEVISDIIV